MTEILIGIGIIVILGGIALILREIKKKENTSTDDQTVTLLLNQVNELSRQMDTRMNESSRAMQSEVRLQFGESQKLVQSFIKELSSMTEKVTRVEETGKQMVGFASELQNLQDLLKNPKQRGILGEYYLETLLKNVLPPESYKMQYAFPEGDIVDAVVFVKDKIIPIDSKFSLENYNRLSETRDDGERVRLEKLFVNDLKNRITETAKYIRPERGTTDFAFMFIPHEAIYYDLLVNKVGALREETESLIQRAAGKYKVIIVSPTSFLAYLQTVLQGLKALQIEERATEIIKRVGELAKHLKTYEDYHSKMGNALDTVVNQYNLGGKEFKKIDKDITRITGDTPQLQVIEVDKIDRE
ncbi:MAG: DNA recombination protein RmuC [Candidatus Paceibacterota bacterium]